MKILVAFFICAFSFIFTLWRWGGMDKKLNLKMKRQVEMEHRALELAKKNRLLTKEISDLKYKISELNSQNKYLLAQEESKEVAAQRKIASIPAIGVNDLVSYEIYQWSPDKLLAVAEKEFHFKNYEKSAQFYNELILRFPKHQLVSPRVLFGGGIAAFESGNHFDWSENHLTRLVTNYPSSEFYRGAKLWLALAQYKRGEHQKFLTTVEEFRLKYRNTDEWKILSRYYENITDKVKQ